MDIIAKVVRWSPGNVNIAAIFGEVAQVGNPNNGRDARNVSVL
jgi:hypothetical protein